MNPLDALRNANLNEAYKPKWQVPENTPMSIVPQGDTRFDPFAGTRWGEWLDAAGAGAPGGMRMKVQTFGQPDYNTAQDPSSTFNTNEGPFGRFGIGTGGNVPTPNSSLSLQGLKKTRR